MTDLSRVVQRVNQLGIIRPLPPAYFYCHSSLCLLDAVYTINARYTAAQNVVSQYSSVYRVSPLTHPTRRTQEEDTIEKLCQRLRSLGPDGFAEKVDNFSRSAGRFKSEVLLDLAAHLLRKGVTNLSQLRGWAAVVNPKSFKEATNITGLGTLTIRYLAMLGGNDSQVKPDRHIQAFLRDTLGRPLYESEAVDILRQAAGQLRVTPRQLDHSIWAYQRR